MPAAGSALKNVAAEEVFDPRGRVMGPVLARVLDISLARLAKTAHLTERALRNNPTSERLQKPGRKIAVLLAGLDGLLGSRKSTLIWLKSPRPQLGHASPLDLLIDGDFDSVETLVYALESGQPDFAERLSLKLEQSPALAGSCMQSRVALS